MPVVSFRSGGHMSFFFFFFFLLVCFFPIKLFVIRWYWYFTIFRGNLSASF